MTAAPDEPVQLLEDADTGDCFLVYESAKGPRLDIRYEGETLWMTQAQIGQLFGVERSVVTKHIANVYADGELESEATSAKIAQVRLEGARRVERTIEHYNLDVRSVPPMPGGSLKLSMTSSLSGESSGGTMRLTTASPSWPQPRKRCPGRRADDFFGAARFSCRIAITPSTCWL